MSLQGASGDENKKKWADSDLHGVSVEVTKETTGTWEKTIRAALDLDQYSVRKDASGFLL